MSVIEFERVGLLHNPFPPKNCTTIGASGHAIVCGKEDLRDGSIDTRSGCGKVGEARHASLLSLLREEVGSDPDPE
jgi:hypothetical protein